MKKYFLAITIILVIAVVSCKKNNTLQVKTETPLQALVNSKFLDSIQSTYTVPVESGYEFTAIKNGRITKIGCYVPQNRHYRVSLWDSTQELLISTTISITDSTKFTYKDILPINIEANKKYIISIGDYGHKTFTFYNKKYPNNNQSIFPILVKNITLLNHRSSVCPAGTPSCFPMNVNIYGSNFIEGGPDFVFEPTE